MKRRRSAVVPICLALLAAGGAVWLGVEGSRGVAGCDPAGGCGEVLHSQWSKFHGIPVAFAGALLWSLLALTAGAFVRGTRSLAGWVGVLAVTGTIVGAGWFLGLMAFALKAFCPVCVAVHCLAVAAAFILIWRRWQAEAGGSLTGGWLVSASTLSLLVAAWPAGGGVAVVALPESTQRLLPVKGGMGVNLAGLPRIGRGEPAGAFLMDFTCTHCRKMLDVLRRMAAQDAAMPAVVVLPASLGEEGEKIHRTLLSLFRADPAAWEKVVAGLLDGVLPPRAELVAHAAMLALGPEKFGAALHEGQDAVRLQMETAAAVYAANRSAPGGSAALPQLMNSDRLLTGLEADAARLASFLGTRPLPPAAAKAPTLAAALPEMRPAKPVAQLPQWRPRPVPPDQQSPRPPAMLTNSNP